MDEARQAANRRRTTAKAKQKNLVTGFEMIKDEPVALTNVARHACAYGIPRNLSPASAKTGIVESDLVLSAVLNHVENLVNVGVIALAAFLSGAIRENNNVLWHSASFQSSRRYLHED